MLPRVAVLLCCALALGGCVAVTEEAERQLEEVGPVEVRTVVCASRPPECPAGNDGRPAGSGEYQLLVGYRVPAATVAPETVVAEENLLSLTPSPSLTAELQRLAPAAPGLKWAGYASGPFTYEASGGPSAAALVAVFGLVRPADGRPFTGPFLLRTVVGYRTVDPGAERPVACGDSLEGGTGDTRCMDWPGPEALPENRQLDTRDVGIVAGGPAAAARGTTVAVPFTLHHAGKGAAPALSFSAATSVPGGTAQPVQTSLAPEPGEHSVPVTLAVPAATGPGTYDVTLTAALGNGQRRSATALVEVSGPAEDRNPPVVTVSLLRRTTIAEVRRRGARVEVSCSEDCTLGVELRQGTKVVGRYAETATAPGRRRFRIRARRAKAGLLTVRVVAVDRAGNRGSRSLRFRAFRRARS